MHAYLVEHYNRLEKRHYICRADTKTNDFWANFRERQVELRVRQYGESFCFVLYRSGADNNAYVLPYGVVKQLLTDQTLYKASTGNRWMLSIRDGWLRVRNTSEQIEVSQYFNAFPLLHTDLPICADLPVVSESPGRIATTINRILRDSYLVAALKEKYKYCCQLCGTSLELPNGFLYCEAHHICPLGKPHNGHDEEENLLIVCPNHHVLLDYGAIPISTDSFHSLNHVIAQSNIKYHNRNIHKSV
jgi:hypothetical protein